MSYLLTSEEVQSSSEAQSGVLENSIDADISTCFITNTETDPWWIIDLEMDYIVSSIVLTTSQDQTGMKPECSTATAETSLKNWVRIRANLGYVVTEPRHTIRHLAHRMGRQCRKVPQAVPENWKL